MTVNAVVSPKKETTYPNQPKGTNQNLGKLAQLLTYSNESPLAGRSPFDPTLNLPCFHELKERK